MYAVIETGGKQYQVNEGDVIFIEKLAVEADETVTFAKVLKNGKAKKITVFTYKPKKGEKKKQGHRQPYTQVKIEAIKA